ncbi:Reverse transcriptase (RNA-dependent DNA polymerase) [Popillia japonica]|uniref:Reverse transcriptase (RNA-dependent DNA polymerase) n=1 Tax=Popillia japonica TaxID=7064 RepID=A0AAW1MU96_POPJA
MDKTYRFCVDYRHLNQVSERDAYPLPYVNNTLDKLRDAKFLSSLDIRSAYWQIPIAEQSRQYTAFTVLNRSLFQFRRMPFGLHNAPATWQRFIDHVLGPELERFVFVYIDDTHGIEEHDPEQLMERSAKFSQLYRDIKSRLQVAYERAKARYDTRHRREDFVPNQLVWRKNFALSDAAQFYTAKLADKFVGRFMIHQRTSSDTYELKTCDGEILPGTWHPSHLKAQPPAD